MSRPSPKLYDALVKAFHKIGRAEFTAAGRLANCSAHIAKRAWEQGWPQKDEFDAPMPAIRDLFHQEIIAARATRAKVTRELLARQAKAMQDAADDAAQQRAIEGMAVRSIMVAVDALARETVGITQSVLPKLQTKINELVLQALDDPETSLTRLQQIITWVNTNLEIIAKTAEKAQTLERKYMGEPDTTIRVVNDQSPEEKIAAITQTLVSLANSGRLAMPPPADKVEAGVKKSDIIDAELFEVQSNLNKMD